MKANPSEFLCAVQAGESFAVLDRKTPIAQIVRLRERPGIRIREPTTGSPTPNKVPLPKPAQLNISCSNYCLKNVKAIDDRLRGLIRDVSDCA